MRFIKLFLLSVFFFAVLLFLLSLLLPSRAIVERSGVIDAPVATVYSQVNDLKGWQAWNPWMAGQKINYAATAGQGAYGTWTVTQAEKRIASKVTITNSEPDKGVYYNMDFEGMKSVKGTFNFKPSSDGKGTVIMWRLETQLGYLPWWKFRGFLADRLTGPQLEDGLTKLKSICEGEVK
ncbi:SRPBCC family protein [Chitinophaga sp. CF118]|uniref:SRPBCC family protein n=1 Tax=Chitinophaga sp. CF118 TaxID=1884367 RepID=UPI000B7C60FE|nr:SRPBCC family protein [Chitinophaga sp. CF118]